MFFEPLLLPPLHQTVPARQSCTTDGDLVGNRWQVPLLDVGLDPDSWVDHILKPFRLLDDLDLVEDSSWFLPFSIK